MHAGDARGAGRAGEGAEDGRDAAARGGEAADAGRQRRGRLRRLDSDGGGDHRTLNDHYDSITVQALGQHQLSKF